MVERKKDSEEIEEVDHYVLYGRNLLEKEKVA
jgi:hypothetical protein